MNLTKRTITLAAVAILPLATANAAYIQGVTTFAGVALLDNANSALATQVSVFLPTVVGVAGDLTPPVQVGQSPSISSPLVLGASPSLVWTLDGFSFTASGPMVGGGGPNNTFSIGVEGILDDGPGGFDPTPAIFVMATTPTIGGLGAFSAITATSAVPEPATYGMFAGLGLFAFGVWRRVRA